MRDNPMPENRHRWDQFEILEKEKDAFLQKLMTDKELRAKYSRVRRRGVGWGGGDL